MKICFIADASHPNTLNWAEYFATKFEHEIHLISFNRPREEMDKVAFHQLKLPVKNKLKYLTPMNSIKRLISSISPDLLIGYRLTSYAFLAAKAGFHPLVVVSQSQKAGGDYRVIRKPVQWLAAKYAIKHADLALAWGPHMANDMASLGCDKNKIFVLPRGVDLRKFVFNPKEGTKDLCIVTTRGLNPKYNFKIVFQAIEKLSRQIEHLNYDVVGDGWDRDRLTKLTRKLRIEDRVDFLGKIPYDSVPRYLNRSDIYVSAVPEDGVSSSLLEAMAVGTFPIVTDIEANRYWKELGCNFLCFNPNRVDDLVDNILKYYHNREEFKNYLPLNRAIVERKGSWVDNMKTIHRALEELVYRGRVGK